MKKRGVMLQGFEWYLPEDGGHWRFIAEHAGELSELGITAVWLPPAYKGASGAADVGYGVYDVYDLGEFNQKGSIRTKYGTKEEYIQAVAALQQEGIQVYADIVLNHMMGADETEQTEVLECAGGQREQVISGVQNIDSWSRFTFPGRAGKYSDFTWNYKHFDGIDWDQKGKRSAIFRYVNKEWEKDVDEENGNYDYLMGADLDFGNEEVVHQLHEWGKWYLDTTGVDGLRLDAVKHIAADFYKNWLPAMREYTGKPLFAVGEYWHREVGSLLKYLQRVEGNMSLFDVPLHFHFYYAATSDGNFPLRDIFKGTLTGENPSRAVTFVDNHDTQPGQALQSYVPAWFRPLAYAMILLREEGYPCVFFGDIYGVPHDGIAPMRKYIAALIQARNRYMSGERREYMDSDDLIGWTYEGGLAVIMTDRGSGGMMMSLGAGLAGRTMRRTAIAEDDRDYVVTLDEQGAGYFETEGGRVAVYTVE